MFRMVRCTIGQHGADPDHLAVCVSGSGSFGRMRIRIRIIWPYAYPDLDSTSFKKGVLFLHLGILYLQVCNRRLQYHKFKILKFKNDQEPPIGHDFKMIRIRNSALGTVTSRTQPTQSKVSFSYQWHRIG